MPIGVIINVTAVVLGSLTGTIVGKRLSDNLKETMNAVLGLCALCMGISAVVLMKNLPAVVFSVILGTLVGLALKLGIGQSRGGDSPDLQNAPVLVIQLPVGLAAIGKMAHIASFRQNLHEVQQTRRNLSAETLIQNLAALDFA